MMNLMKIMMICAMVLIVTSAQAVTVDIYEGFTTDVGGGAPYTNLAGSFTSADIQFATATGYDWHPFGLAAFGAEMTGCLLVAADGVYTFGLDSDDGSMLYVDDVLVVDNGGPHVPTLIYDDTFLAAGYHSFKVEFFEDHGGPSGVDLILPGGVVYTACPVYVPIDIKPGSCPNPINVKSNGVLPVAILGTDTFDVDQVDPASVALEGVPALRYDLKDVATPFEPFIGRQLASDCTEDGPDGSMDLTLKFETQAVVAALGDVSDGQVLVVQLTGNLLDGTPIVGEDVVVIISKVQGGSSLSLGDDDFEEVSLGFTFPYQGQEWTSVFVNSNGNLTFGSGSTSFIEDVPGFLSGPPRIAALWNDLNPTQGGTITLAGKNNSLTISFNGIPEFFASGSNTFSITLKSSGTVDIEYGTVSASDGIVGVTEGNGALNPGPTDLSTAKGLSVTGTTYQQFVGLDPFDLDGTNLKFHP